MNIFHNIFTAVFLLGTLSILLMVNYFFLTEIILGRRKLDTEIKYTIVPNPNKIVGCERKATDPLFGFNVPIANELVLRLSRVRVLRSSCSDSLEGDFRVHLPEKDWDEIQKLVKEMKEG